MNNVRGLLIEIPDEGFVFRTYTLKENGGMKATDYKLKVCDLPIEILFETGYYVLDEENKCIRYKGHSHE